MPNSVPPKRAHIPHKWGFGMAPPRAEQTARRDAAVARVTRYLNNHREAYGRRDEVADAISEIKGLFTRSWKNDQWDWFVVYTRLGSPTNRISRQCSHALGELARGLRTDDAELVERGRTEFDKWGGRRWLKSWVDGSGSLDDGWGFIYVLSSRDDPNMLKIGFTNRPVEQRVAEINNATGVVVPFGARRAWKVRGARDVEGLVHAALGEYRVRADREFFQLDGRDALRIIDAVVVKHRLEA